LALLQEGIVDTIRVSLSDSPEKEVIAGREILRTAAELSPGARSSQGARNSPGMRGSPGGVHIISCPRCGRSSFDSISFVQAWENRLYALEKDLSVAIMGCAVNGPEEARHADLGITGAGDKALIFRRGKLVRTIDAVDADSAFEEELNRF
jgi:(E)-4-hydroxy-3-methylbut-2-enyl-diphosphate synthase